MAPPWSGTGWRTPTAWHGSSPLNCHRCRPSPRGTETLSSPRTTWHRSSSERRPR
ncbi:hypothetical protein ACFFX0_01930 [Citricoccus parietis]|uniref:Uncharacterized protein n=1 Tax=Citricoccus parietis TaxID=592307 RepID=A0ABV5FUR8_9MICC